jgi:hypothetical protein
VLDEQYTDAHSDLIKLDGRQYAHMSGYMYRLFLVVPSQRLPIVLLFGSNMCGLDTGRTRKDRNRSVDQCLPRLSRAVLIVSYRFLDLRESIVLDNGKRIPVMPLDIVLA